MKEFLKWTRKELLYLPKAFEKGFDGGTFIYTSIIVIPSRRKHSSGWAQNVVIGARNLVPVEIISDCCDDLQFNINTYIRVDSSPKSLAVNYWRAQHVFRLDSSPYSSITFGVIKNPATVGDSGGDKIP